MKTPGSTNPGSDPLDIILQKLNEVARKSAEGGFIYRGENQLYPDVSSGLFRSYKDLAVEDLNVEYIQQEIVRDAKRFTTEADDFEILDQLQHYGYQTNLIDFTTDYHVALYFACDGHFDKDGRLILIRKESVTTRVPRGPTSRVIAQKSVFVIPSTGMVEPDATIVIPAHLKHHILGHLRECHSISAETIYNDLHGFIRQRREHQSSYAEFCIGLSPYRDQDYPSAIEHYSRSIELAPQLFFNFVNRGQAYAAIGESDLALFDLNKAIELNSNEPIAFYNRGNILAQNGEMEQAISNYNRTIELNPNHVGAYLNRGHAHAICGSVNEAIQDYSLAIVIDPTLLNAYCSRGVEQLKRGEVQLGIKDFNTAIDLDKDCAMAYSGRGFAQILNGEYGLAIQDCTVSIRLNGSDEISLYNRGVAHLFLAQFDQAYVDLKSASDLGYDVAATFLEEYGTMAVFEQKQGVCVPSEIHNLLATI